MTNGTFVIKKMVKELLQDIKISTCKTKSLSDSIKKHVFQKKVFGNKKVMDPKYSCNFSRSSSEENMLSNVNW